MVAVRQCANRSVFVGKLYQSFFDEIKRESWIADMIDGIAFLQMNATDHLGHFDIQKTDVAREQQFQVPLD